MYKYFTKEMYLTEEELKSEYRVLSKKYHPDVSSSGPEEFAEMANEYARILKSVKRGDKTYTAEQVYKSLYDEIFDGFEGIYVSVDTVFIEICITKTVSISSLLTIFKVVMDNGIPTNTTIRLKGTNYEFVLSEENIFVKNLDNSADRKIPKRFGKVEEISIVKDKYVVFSSNKFIGVTGFSLPRLILRKDYYEDIKFLLK